MQTAEILKLLRQESGLTQGQLGKNLGIGQATIAAYENGKREPHIVSLIAYADFFDCSIDYLVGRVDDFGTVIEVEKRNQRLVLNPDEIALVESYRRMDRSTRLKLTGYIDALK